jgi:hypothetical protein
MTSINDSISGAETVSGALACARQNAGHGSDIAIASGQVIARRVALGMAAALNPLRADHVELARIVPEKVEAFSAAGMIVLERSDQANRQMRRFASDELSTAARSMMTMAACASPAALTVAQGRFWLAWFDRATSGFMAMGMLALGTPAAAMAPIRQTVVANAERLGR